MGNLILQMRLMKNCLIYHWRSSLLSIVSVGFFSMLLLILRYNMIDSIAYYDNSNSLYLFGQILVILLFILCTWGIAINKVLNNASEFKSFIVIGLNNSEILLCLVANSLIVTVLGFSLAGVLAIHYLPIGQHVMEHSLWEALSMVIGGTCISVAIGATVLKRCLDDGR
ncbi:hypothetical protein BIT28_15620 [Photobacterium proteolyticum]|uniref:FtsX-like permease family protein n=1 Tax=Photobacterium proteolyticum TaxID=1903952 RepID=A0A1Q9GYY2_9GAMM|nr:hypothetical protein BIT28_15620 [Photobacterium proteolyticum]